MAISAVVYCSNTGHTKRYAQMFAEKTGLPLYDGAQAQKDLPRGTRIVFFGWLLSGKIQGFEKAWKKFDVAAACSVGLYPDSERFRAYVERNNILIDTQYFHLRGTLFYEEKHSALYTDTPVWPQAVSFVPAWDLGIHRRDVFRYYNHGI